MLTNKLSILRRHMRDLGIKYFLVLSNDAHASEYVSAADGRRQFITGFSGSAGTALIGEEKAYLWTDGRYFLQAETELAGRPAGEEWELMRSGQPGVLEPGPFLAKLYATAATATTLNSSSALESVKVGVDPSYITAAAALAIRTAFKGTSVELTPVVGSNPVDLVWALDPESPHAQTQTETERLSKSSIVPCVPYSVRYAGVTHNEKIGMIQSKLRQCHAHAMVVSMLDEVAWLYNIRGGDVPCNPVSICYAVVTTNSAHLFIDHRKMVRSADPRGDIFSHLAGADIQVHPYSTIDSFLSELYADCLRTGKHVLCDLNQINFNLYSVLSGGGGNDSGSADSVIVNRPSLITLPKAIKNAVEIEGARQAHIRDGVALTAFLYWLEQQYNDPSSPTVTEYKVGEILEGFRKRVALFRNPSFETIAGYGENGAIVHYRAKEGHSATVGRDSFLLLDSGGQYLDGTTDVTRTVALGAINGDSNTAGTAADTRPISDHMRKCYSLVLKGHVSLASLQFPMDTKGSIIDGMARMHLWRHGLDYGHGTGHGVGSFLNVHEGPQGIGFRSRPNEVGFVPGMITSIEPGYYEAGGFGIRIENLYITVPVPAGAFSLSGNKTTKQFCRFEPLTMVPIKLNIADLSLLSRDDVDWVNQYHSEVRQKLLPLMKELFPESVKFLLRDTEKIPYAY